MRLFIAIPISEAIGKWLLDSFKALGVRHENLRITKKTNFHVTLKFLGDTDVSEIDPLTRILAEVAEDHVGAELSFTHGLLMPPHRPRAVALGIHATDELTALQRAIDEALADGRIAQPERKQYRPHITLARTRAPLSPDEERAITEWAPQKNFSARQMTLYESTLKPDGPVYEAIAEYPLL